MTTTGEAGRAVDGELRPSGKRRANERTVSPWPSVDLGVTQAPVLTLESALGDTQRHLLAQPLMPLHGGGQGFDSPAVHQVFYAQMQGFPALEELPLKDLRFLVQTSGQRTKRH